MTKQNDVTGWYGEFFKAWQPKVLGRKPTATELDTIHKLGARPGKQALANAMALRECGVTGGQIVVACGAPQLNKMRGFITDGLLKREAVPATGAGHTVYKLTLTAKGASRVKATEAAKAATVKSKPVAKAKVKAKAKAKAAAPVAAPAQPVQAEPVAAEQAQS